jgi:hypothetical protein
MKNIKQILLICIYTAFSLTTLATTSYTVSSIPYSPYPYTGGTTLAMFDDVNSPPLPIGFNFQFFDVIDSTVIINSNGVLGFSNNPSLRVGPGTNYREIYANLHDLYPGSSMHPGNVNYYTVGIAPNRVFVANYYDIVRFGSSCTSHNYTGQVVLHETSNNIDVYLQQKDSCDTNIPNSAIGIADTGGVNIYAPGRTFTNWYGENEGWRFCFNGSCATADADYSFIKGRVYFDANNDCINTIGELGLPLNNIELFDSLSSSIRYASTDIAGNYTALIENGDWRVRLIPSSYILAAPCPDHYVHIDSTIDSGVADLAGTIRSCPYLSTNISASWMRPCSTVVYYLNYFNGGSTSAATYIDVTLDTTVTYDSATVALLSVIGNIYRFDLGAVPLLSGGSFQLYTTANCWLVDNQTVCAEAHIYPDSICPPPPVGWDQSDVKADAYEDTTGIDSVVLRLRNRGPGNMSSPTVLTIVEDIIMIVNTTTILNAGEEVSYKFPSNGKTYRIQAEQTINNPNKTYTSASIEGSTESSSDVITYGLINDFPLDDEPVYIDITCNEINTSFDPNLKSSSPSGFTDVHFLEKNTIINYRVDFQNTGSDTAFYVAIEDSISPFLNLGSIQLTNSSHPCSYILSSNDKVKFEFNDIRLQDSTSNEPASHGFVEFSIEQKPNLPDGSVIFNYADIIFDVNAPVRTNTIFHTIGRLSYSGFKPTDANSFDVNVFPNPFQNEIHIESDKINDPTVMKIYNMDGKLISISKSVNHQFTIQRKDLHQGMYLFEIIQESKTLGTGKFVAL